MPNKANGAAPIVFLTPDADKEWRDKDGLYHRANGPARAALTSFFCKEVTNYLINTLIGV